MKTRTNTCISQIAKLIFIFLILSSCSAPKTILHSGKVTRHKQLRVGFDYSLNIATQPLKSIVVNTKDLVDIVSNTDSVVYGDVVSTLNKAALAYALDPIGTGYNFYGRYGLLKKLDIGYKYASGPHVFDIRYQFKGSGNTFDEPGEDGGYGSVGLQYSSQSYDLPEWTGLDRLQGVLGLKFKRKDLLIPLVFSNSFGPEEKYGAVSYGLVYGHSFINYSFDPKNIYWAANTSGAGLNTTIIPSVNVKKNYPSFGAFANIRFGYKYFFGLLSFAMYYQNYGTYQLLGGENVKFKGFSFVPSAGFFFDIPFKKIFKKKAYEKQNAG